MLFEQTHWGAALCRKGDPAVPSAGVEQDALWGSDDVAFPTSAFSIWPITCVLQSIVRKLSHPGVRGGMGFLLVFVLKQTLYRLAQTCAVEGAVYGASPFPCFQTSTVLFVSSSSGGSKEIVFQNPHGFQMLDTTMSWFRQNEFRVFLKSLGRSEKPLPERAEILKKKLQKSVPASSVWFWNGVI